jgi:tripeptidyl-peptidase-1
MLSDPSSKTSATSVPASINALAAVVLPILCLRCVFRSAASRGIPDVSAQALRYWFIFGDDTVPESGTSYAALVCPSSLLSMSFIRGHPAEGDCLDLLNDHLVSIDDPPLSFLNPCLYSNGLVGLNDITSGSNPGYSTDGFSAIAGWDPVRSVRLLPFVADLELPVTGLETPNIVKLQRILDNRNLHTGHKPFDDKENDE